MKAWRVLLMTLSFMLLGGCLVTFDAPLPEKHAAPKALLGQWSSKDAWGEPLELAISRSGEGRYKAVAKGKTPETYPFSVSRQGQRWYFSLQLPARQGGKVLIGGFDIVEGKELVLYTLDLEQMQQVVAQKALSGRSVELPDDEGQGVVIDSPAEQVLAYLDDPANSDLFVEAARFQRAGK